MRRRKFITVLGGAAATWPLAALAQPMSSQPFSGILSPLSSAAPHILRAFRTGLRELGSLQVVARGVSHGLCKWRHSYDRR
jgi:putative tryptophan/tyrosine transport system substrate-binding protein